ncbi:hypothetical protein COX86_02170 [Candidatus Micrarchaeota archaeon CG_4_10_14_0_2_um_filter_60_11]|nr:MAG: hypothetical protein AUJ16_02705 [Candidatus Micrarchaeota archaeon CG1_02_60_51]PIN96306.1 MAG: hypothetical protein COU39_01860 [Candidatus Micrarchaeota archaeon CG10_big_fil_rev_8_21_14_0_10_60_32]PIO01957.1 MAG: hypothetical protein COT58_02410 [Candidatus Micrarchaeota archaeon CG09_land_8_20_14_0_10_60_16]PIY91119.1 MAG: hypothetical protein COY71_04870 [Candidatus Micrarchaeota archaeon CG_4_10_14_0_8_um_filter_60_7]PIZ90927.1 MAG: hypothetical protein COX86_02170 [Candidatus Mi
MAFDFAKLSPKKTALGAPHFSDPRYSPLAFDEARFQSFEAEAGRLTCVDGGNASVINTPNLSVQLVRVYRNEFDGGERKTSEESEFLVITRVEPASGGQMLLKAETMPLNGPKLLQEDLAFDWADATLAQGGFKASPSALGAVARRFAEWKMACRCFNPVRDGTLQTSVTNESIFSRKAYAESKGVFSALAKTSSLYTTTGLPLVSAVARLAGKRAAPWVYGPLCVNSQPDHEADLFVAKLHENATHCFRFEVKRGCDALSVLPALAFQASDLAFLGYPYGLVDADKRARVPFEEARQMQGVMRQEIGEGAWREIELDSCAVDAHDFLDRV